MTVEELIKELKKWPKDSQVEVEGNGPATEVDWFYNDPKNFGVIINDWRE